MLFVFFFLKKCNVLRTSRLCIFSRTKLKINNICKTEIRNISLKTHCTEMILLLTVVLKDISSVVFLLKFMEIKAGNTTLS